MKRTNFKNLLVTTFYKYIIQCQLKSQFSLQNNYKVWGNSGYINGAYLEL